MVELTNIQVFNFEGAIRGMRQPFKNTQKSDSIFGIASEDTYYDILSEWVIDTFFIDSPHEFECVWSYYDQGIINDDEDAIVKVITHFEQRGGINNDGYSIEYPSLILKKIMRKHRKLIMSTHFEFNELLKKYKKYLVD